MAAAAITSTNLYIIFTSYRFTVKLLRDNMLTLNFFCHIFFGFFIKKYLVKKILLKSIFLTKYVLNISDNLFDFLTLTFFNTIFLYS